jgi:hypothetical protein
MKTWGSCLDAVSVRSASKRGMAIRLSYCDCVLFWPAAAQAPFSGVGKLHGLNGLSG